MKQMNQDILVVFGLVLSSSNSVEFLWEIKVRRKRAKIRQKRTKISGRKINIIFSIIELNTKKNLTLVNE